MRGPGISEEFRVDVGIRQGRALSLLLFIAVLEVISRKTRTRDILLKLIYEVAVVADSETDLQERFVEWKEICGRHGLIVSLEKTEVLRDGQHKAYIHMRLDGKKLNQRDSFVYFGSAVCGGTEMKTRKKIQAGASAWRKVEREMGGRHLSRKLKEKVFSSCIRKDEYRN